MIGHTANGFSNDRAAKKLRSCRADKWCILSVLKK